MKKGEGYELEATLESEKVEFRFTSIGEKGLIEKIIEFQKKPQGFWNLAFGDVTEDDWEDNIITDNGDLRKVIQTIANAVYLFLTIYPDQEIIIIPLDRQRKLLYNRVIQQRWHEIEPFFIVKAIVLEGENPKFENYSFKKIFDYFRIKQKID
jgi:hypothetical protein